jgi:hypothetical protein
LTHKEQTPSNNPPCDPSDDTRADIIFRYYEDQWNHVRHHESLRSELTMQIVVAAGALVVAYFQFDPSKVNPNSIQMVRFIVGGLVSSLGLIGLIVTYKMYVTTVIHITRAREARRALDFLERFPNTNKDFPPLHWYYGAFHLLIIVTGILLLSLQPPRSAEKPNVQSTTTMEIVPHSICLPRTD